MFDDKYNYIIIIIIAHNGIIIVFIIIVIIILTYIYIIIIIPSISIGNLFDNNYTVHTYISLYIDFL